MNIKLHRELLLLASIGIFHLAAHAATVTTTYTYDDAGRLTQADYGGEARIDYFYDANGNLLCRRTTGTASAAMRIWVDTGSGTAPVALDFGEAETAQDGEDEWDAAAAPNAVAYLAGADTPEAEALAWDFRPLASITRWRLVLAGEVRNTVTLTWDVATAAAGREVYLQQIVGEQPVGFPLDMREPRDEPLTVPAGTEWEIAYAVPMETVIELEGGWNLIGSPVMSKQTTGAILDDGSRSSLHLGPLWYWTGHRYRPWRGTEPFCPERGYWGYWPAAAGESAPITGVRADGRILLRPGWNLISPAADTVLRQIEGISLPAWAWNASLQVYQPVHAEGTLEPRRGYWLRVSASEPVLFESGPQ